MPEESDARYIIKIMNERLKHILNDIDLSGLNKLKLNMHELLTFASLIEKEAKIPSERKYISAVFHNRRRFGMKMDCDPTVRYAVKKFTGAIYRKDLESESPYNTYVHYGLPPTPISSIGMDSIISALNPAPVDFLFFVARNNGSHYFSRTLKEHYRAVDYYQKGIKNGFIDKQRL